MHRPRLPALVVTRVHPAARCRPLRIGGAGDLLAHLALQRHAARPCLVGAGHAGEPALHRRQGGCSAAVDQLLRRGQRQRVAIARALAVEPKVLLLDEPFGALDAQVRKELRRWLRRLHDDLHVTSIFVTHDQEEALSMADRVAVLSHGKLEQFGSPSDVYDRPQTLFVNTFVGKAMAAVMRSSALPSRKFHTRSAYCTSLSCLASR